MVERTPRVQQTREAGERKSSWKRQSMLPTPEPRAGMKFRWVRTSALGQADMTNVSRRFREGYVPVKATEFPELHIMTDIDSRFPENIEVGGLLLCAILPDIAEDRTIGQAADARDQMEAVDRNYLRESDPRMPVLAPERSSRTTFGKG
jgi:hypothetical protein